MWKLMIRTQSVQKFSKLSMHRIEWNNILGLLQRITYIDYIKSPRIATAN
jgi:hypothetical protein